MYIRENRGYARSQRRKRPLRAEGFSGIDMAYEGRNEDGGAVGADPGRLAAAAARSSSRGHERPRSRLGAALQKLRNSQPGRSGSWRGVTCRTSSWSPGQSPGCRRMIQEAAPLAAVGTSFETRWFAALLRTRSKTRPERRGRELRRHVFQAGLDRGPRVGRQRRHREEPTGRRGDPGDRRAPYAPLDRHASLAMTVCNLSTPRPGLGDTAAHKIRPKALKTLKTNSGTARVVQLEGKWLAAKRPSGGTKSKVRRSQPAGRAAADKIRRKALKRLKTDSAKVRVVQLRGKGQPSKRPSGGTKGKVRRSQPAGGAARLGVAIAPKTCRNLLEGLNPRPAFRGLRTSRPPFGGSRRQDRPGIARARRALCSGKGAAYISPALFLPEF
jgi:hypothetical protein